MDAKLDAKGSLLRGKPTKFLVAEMGCPREGPPKRVILHVLLKASGNVGGTKKKKGNFYLQFLPFIYYAGQMMINHDKPLDGLGSPIFNSYRRGYLTREPLGIDLTIEHRN